MSAIQWTPELLAAASAIIALLVGSLTTALFKNRKQVQLETQLELVTNSNEESFKAKTELEESTYQYQLANSKLTQKFEYLSASSELTEERLRAENIEYKQKLNELNERLEQSHERHSQAEIALKASVTSAASLEKRQQELRESVQQLQEKLETERTEAKLVSAELTELKTTLNKKNSIIKSKWLSSVKLSKALAKNLKT